MTPHRAPPPNPVGPSLLSMPTTLSEGDRLDSLAVLGAKREASVQEHSLHPRSGQTVGVKSHVTPPSDLWGLHVWT